MSVLWGIRKETEALVTDAELRGLGAPTSRYAKEPANIYSRGQVGMGIKRSATHELAVLGKGITQDICGNVIAFDGRLDNTQELSRELRITSDMGSDGAIVLAAYRQWDLNCFSHLTGDWALALWSATRRQLILAVDHAGTRTLYFRWTKRELVWSTYLETFAAHEPNDRLSAGYAAAYLAGLPTANNTPFESIGSLVPGQFIVFDEDFASEGLHWTPCIKERLQYSSDQEYDEQFLAHFKTAVSRRTGPGVPILAQLSGGMDSTSIVCMSDHIRRSVDPGAPLIDTISFYDDSEIQDERAFIAVTESYRKKAGIRFNTAMSRRTFEPPPDGAYLIPGADSFAIEQECELEKIVWQKGYRVILSGLGGDELLGGIPTGLPRLADLLMSGRWIRLFHESLEWCLVNRTPLLHSFRDTVLYGSRLYLRGSAYRFVAPPWLSRKLKPYCRSTSPYQKSALKRLQFTPSQLDNAGSWAFVLETLPHRRPQHLFRPEYRYPMLDKDLVNFLFSVPPDQLVRPGRRRAMMRRALQGTVPTEILERKRKGFHQRSSLSALSDARDKITGLWKDPLLAQEGFVDVDALRRESELGVNGDARWSQALMRTIAYELWLRSLRPKGRRATLAA